MPLTPYPHGISSFGIPVIGMGGAPMPVPGNVYFVHPAQDSSLGSGTITSSDGNLGTMEKPLKTLSRAHTVMTANQNDTAIVIGNSSASAANTVRETAALAWSKSLCHIMGTGYNRISHRASIRATGNFTPLVNVTADGCVFANFHVFHGYATAETQIAWTETGQRNAHYNLHIAGMGDATAADQAGSRSLLLTGDGERYFEDCVIGLDTISRSTTNAEIELKSSAVRDIFRNCMVLAYADNAGHLFLKADDAAAALDRFALFDRVLFINGGTDSGGSTMTEAIAAHASLTGVIILKDCTLVGATDWEAATVSGKVMIDGAAPTAASSGLAVDVAA